MDVPEAGADTEFAAIQSVFRALEPLDPRSRERVFEYIAARLGISAVRRARSSSSAGDEENGGEPILEEDLAPEPEFATLADLHDAAGPGLDKDRVLVAAYWLQVCKGEENFVGYSVNKALKDLGHGVSNVTGAFDALRRQKPALVLQLKKSGQEPAGPKDLQGYECRRGDGEGDD